LRRTTCAIAAALLATSALGACSDDEGGAVCGLGADEVVALPTGEGVPLNAAARALVGARSDRLRIRLIEDASDLEVPGAEAIYATSFGDVVELVPDGLLAADTRYRVEVLGRFGDVLGGSSFLTGGHVEEGHAATDEAPTVRYVAEDDRACCSGRGCRNGSLIALSPPREGNFAPQLLLISVDEHYNDACGAAVRSRGIVPVVWRGSDRPLEAETDLLLDGCFELSVETQTLRDASPGVLACAQGRSFTPRPVVEGCEPQVRGDGCLCRGASAPAQDVAALLAGLALLSWLTRRRRGAEEPVANR